MFYFCNTTNCNEVGKVPLLDCFWPKVNETKEEVQCKDLEKEGTCTASASGKGCKYSQLGNDSSYSCGQVSADSTFKAYWHLYGKVAMKCKHLDFCNNVQLYPNEPLCPYGRENDPKTHCIPTEDHTCDSRNPIPGPSTTSTSQSSQSSGSSGKGTTTTSGGGTGSTKSAPSKSSGGSTTSKGTSQSSSSGQTTTSTGGGKGSSTSKGSTTTSSGGKSSQKTTTGGGGTSSGDTTETTRSKSSEKRMSHGWMSLLLIATILFIAN